MGAYGGDISAHDVTLGQRTIGRSRPGMMIARLESAAADDLCLVTDISPHGAGLRTARPRATGEAVTLDFGDALAIPGSIQWSADGSCGIKFDQVVDLAPLMRVGVSGSDGLKRRSEPRLRRCADAEIVHGERRMAGRLFDVSPGGARFNLPDTDGLAIGDRLSFWVEDRFDGEGVIRWIAPHAIGVMFDVPLRLWKLEKWLVEKIGKCGGCAADDCAAPSFQLALTQRDRRAGHSPTIDQTQA